MGCTDLLRGHGVAARGEPGVNSASKGCECRRAEHRDRDHASDKWTLVAAIDRLRGRGDDRPNGRLGRWGLRRGDFTRACTRKFRGREIDGRGLPGRDVDLGEMSAVRKVRAQPVSSRLHIDQPVDGDGINGVPALVDRDDTADWDGQGNVTDLRIQRFHMPDCVRPIARRGCVIAGDRSEVAKGIERSACALLCQRHVEQNPRCGIDGVRFRKCDARALEVPTSGVCRAVLKSTFGLVLGASRDLLVRRRLFLRERVATRQHGQSDGKR